MKVVLLRPHQQNRKSCLDLPVTASTKRTEFVDSIFGPVMSMRKAAPRKRTFAANF